MYESNRELDLEAFVVALKRDRKLKLLNFVTFTVGTGSPRPAPTPRTPNGFNGVTAMNHDDATAMKLPSRPIDQVRAIYGGGFPA